MSNAKPAFSVLIVDDDPQILQVTTAALSTLPVNLVTASDPESAIASVQENRPRVVFLDLRIPGVKGFQLLDQIVSIDPLADVVVVSGNDSPEDAAETIQRGAAGYLSKPVRWEKLRQVITERLEEVERQQRASALDEELVSNFSFEGIVGRSPLMLDVYDRIKRIGPHFQMALVTGHTGTGKELVARALHRRSRTPSGPFVACNCSAIVETLFESELFGHVKGAFTGATQSRAGMFETARGGTLFLDEVGDLPQTVQAKLLRVLQEREIQRVGSNTSTRVDVRVVAATNRNLAAMVAKKEFRDDLYHRLSVLEIDLPSLAERREDLPMLIHHFLQRWSREHDKAIQGLTRRAESVLLRYSWPGNVRELENTLYHACVMTKGTQIDVEDLPAKLSEKNLELTGNLTLRAVKREHVQKVLEMADGNREKAAAILGIARTTLYRYLNEDPASQDEE